MKRVILLFGVVTAMFVFTQASFAACPCPSDCDIAAPCGTACPVATCPCDNSCDCGCAQAPKKKCTWWKIFEDKCCCSRCNDCYDGCVAKRCNWWKFWEDRRCVKTNAKKCDCGCDCGCGCK